MAWVGSKDRIEDCLKVYADVDEQGGGWLVRSGSGGVISFLGADDEFVITSDVEIRVNGEWKPLIPLLKGGVVVSVIF